MVIDGVVAVGVSEDVLARLLDLRRWSLFSHAVGREAM